jgi:vitamin B12 transporter
MCYSFFRKCFSFLIACFCFTLALSGQEANDSSGLADVVMDEIVVSVSRIKVPFSEVLRSINVCTYGDIRLNAVEDAGAALEMLPGTDIRQRGAPGQQADISIRGGSFDQTLVLVNGVNVSDPQTGHHNMDLPLNLTAIEKIELLLGPGARIFGPNAFNGVVNVIVKDPEKNSFSARFSAGSYGSASGGVSVSFKNKNISDLLTAGYSSSDGYVENTDFINTNIFNYLKIREKGMRFELQTGYASKAFGANSFYTPKYPDQFEKTKTIFGSLKAVVTEEIAPVFYWRRHYDCFELFRNNAPSWYSGHNYHLTDAIGSDFNYQFNTVGRFRTSLGYNLRYERILSNKLGEKLNEKKPVPGTDGIYYLYGADRFNAGVMAEESFKGRRWNFSGGVLINFSEGTNKMITIYPGLDAGYAFSQELRMFTSVNRTLRQPTFTDLYYNDVVSVGNPDLAPEEAWALETGLKYNCDNFSSEVTVFRRSGKNMIDWIKADGEDKWSVKNLTSVNVSGIELSGQYEFEKNGSSFLKYISSDYSWLYADKSSSGFQSKYLLDILRNKFDVKLAHYLTKRIVVCWNLSWQDRSGGFIKYTDGVADSAESPYPDILLLDCRLTYRYELLRLFIEATNIANAKYYDIGNVVQSGRWLRAGVVFETDKIKKSSN